MADLSNLIRKQNQYKNLLTNVTSIANNISNVDDLSQISGLLVDAYTINDLSADNGNLKNLDSRLEEIRSFLLNTIIPSIKTKLKNLEKDIEQEVSENG